MGKECDVTVPSVPGVPGGEVVLGPQHPVSGIGDVDGRHYRYESDDGESNCHVSPGWLMSKTTLYIPRPYHVIN